MSSESQTKRILWIENDKSLAGKLGELLSKRLGAAYHLEHAYHMEEAALKLRAGGYDALIVDVMLPRTAEDQKNAEDLERRREKLLDRLGGVGQWRDPAKREAERKSILAEIDKMDTQLDGLTDLQGGVRLLEEFLGDGTVLKTRVIMLTARTLPGLQERARRLVETGRFDWIDKPASVGTLLNILRPNGNG
jgi:DNA-binding response OmpR family regulator